MTPWRITHINAWHQRHVLFALASSSHAAEQQAEALWGPAIRCACINLSRPRA